MAEHLHRRYPGLDAWVDLREDGTTLTFAEEPSRVPLSRHGLRGHGHHDTEGQFRPEFRGCGRREGKTVKGNKQTKAGA